MRKNFLILLIAVIVILIGSVGAYTLLTPQYKNIEINGYAMEVSDSDVNVTKVNDNYITYEDTKNNITIKSYGINNVNETNYTVVYELKDQMNKSGENITIANKTVVNQSGKYTYYDLDSYQIISISCDNYDKMTNILETLNKTQVKPNANTTVNLTTLTNETNDTVQTSTTTKKSTSSSSKKSSSKSSKSSSYASEDDMFVVNPETGMREYGPAHPNYGTPNDYLYEEHRSN